MDRGDTGFIIHESFKDLKARRAEQEAYRKALEEQIMQKRKLQEQEREKYEGRRAHHELYSTTYPTGKTGQPLPFHNAHIPPPEAYKSTEASNSSFPPTTDIAGPLQSTPLTGQNRPLSRGRTLSFKEAEICTEARQMPAKSDLESNAEPRVSTTTSIPEFSPECMKYLQQVMPGFTLPPLPPTPSARKDATSAEVTESTPRPCNDELLDVPKSCRSSSEDRNQAFSSGTTSESSSTEDCHTPSKAKIHVSQTSEQLEGVKVSRKQYRQELQKQIDERKRREEELRQQAEEEEARIQEKIRIEQEKMQREYEEELRKQEEREREAEKKRLETLAKQNEIIRVKEQSKGNKCTGAMQAQSSQDDVIMLPGKNSGAVAQPLSNDDNNMHSIDEFFDETMSHGKKYIDPDERIIPVVAKKLREKSVCKMGFGKQLADDDKMALTARVEPRFADSSRSVQLDQGPPPPHPGLIREMAIRSAPCPSTTNFADLEFLSTLKNYLQSEKSKMEERVHARGCKSSEKF